MNESQPSPDRGGEVTSEIPVGIPDDADAFGEVMNLQPGQGIAAQVEAVIPQETRDTLKTYVQRFVRLFHAAEPGEIRGGVRVLCMEVLQHKWFRLLNLNASLAAVFERGTVDIINDFQQNFSGEEWDVQSLHVATSVATNIIFLLEGVSLGIARPRHWLFRCAVNAAAIGGDVAEYGYNLPDLVSARVARFARVGTRIVKGVALGSKVAEAGIEPAARECGNQLKVDNQVQSIILMTIASIASSLPRHVSELILPLSVLAAWKVFHRRIDHSLDSTFTRPLGILIADFKKVTTIKDLGITVEAGIRAYTKEHHGKIDDVTALSIILRQILENIGSLISAHAKKYALTKEGAGRTQKSVMFTDLIGYTKMSEELGDVGTCEVVNTLLGRIVTLTEKFDGTVDKLLGDGCFAVNDSSDEMLRTAIAIVESLNAVDTAIDVLLPGKDREAAQTIFAQCRIGLGFGQVMFSPIGTEARTDYTIMGDTVNRTSRLEGLAKQYGVRVLLSEDIYGQLQDDHLREQCRCIDRVTVLGSQHPMYIYTVDTAPKDSRFLTLFQRGLSCYLRGSWKEAHSLFAQAKTIDSEDGPADVLFRRTVSSGEDLLVAMAQLERIAPDIIEGKVSRNLYRDIYAHQCDLPSNFVRPDPADPSGDWHWACDCK